MKKFLILFLFIHCRINSEKPPALENCAASCYLNTSIQILYNIQSLTDILTKGSNPYIPLAVDESQKIFNNPSYYYTQLIREFIKPTRPSIFSCAPNTTLNTLAYSLPYLGLDPARHEDASQFIESLLNSLINIDLFENQKKAKEINGKINSKIKITTRSTIQCPPLGGLSQEPTIKIEPHKMLHLEVAGNSLKASLDSFFKQETLEGYTDIYGNLRTDCTKQLSIASARDIVLLSLKRHRLKAEALLKPIGERTVEKILDKIEIPLQIKLGEYFTRPIARDGAFNYDLIGVAIHSGGLSCGHYWAYVKTINGQWYKCDDRSITLVNINNSKVKDDIEGGKGPTGYLFVYQKSFVTKKLEKERKRKEAEQAAFRALSNELEKLTGNLRSLTNLLK